MALFGRKVLVKIGSLEIDGLDVRFTVHKTAKAEPNKAEIVIFNLGKNNREALEREESPEVELSVGYEEGDVEGVLFRGDMQESFSEHAAPDWITTLRTGDGDKQIRETRINNSYPPGTSFETLWRDTVNALKNAGIGGGNALAAFRDAAFKNNVKQFVHGGNASGLAYQEMQRLADAAGLEVHIEGKTLVVLKQGKPLEASHILLSPDSGLIGSPQRGTKGELKCRALLIPDLAPKQKVEIDSRLVTGLYTITKATYKGDTASNDWYADLECKEAK